MATDPTSGKKGRFYRPAPDSTTAPRTGIVPPQFPADPRDLESAVLRGLVYGRADTDTHAQVVRILCAYRFQSLVNELAFEVVRTHRTISTARLREHLPALLTNQGFPDEDWEPLLQPTDWTSAQLLRAAHLLLAQRPV